MNESDLYKLDVRTIPVKPHWHQNLENALHPNERLCGVPASEDCIRMQKENVFRKGNVKKREKVCAYFHLINGFSIILLCMFFNIVKLNFKSIAFETSEFLDWIFDGIQGLFI